MGFVLNLGSKNDKIEAEDNCYDKREIEKAY